LQLFKFKIIKKKPEKFDLLKKYLIYFSNNKKKVQIANDTNKINFNRKKKKKKKKPEKFDLLKKYLIYFNNNKKKSANRE